jgi:hypothetical protein
MVADVVAKVRFAAPRLAHSQTAIHVLSHVCGGPRDPGRFGVWQTECGNVDTLSRNPRLVQLRE